MLSKSLETLNIVNSIVPISSLRYLHHSYIICQQVSQVALVLQHVSRGLERFVYNGVLAQTKDSPCRL